MFRAIWTTFIVVAASGPYLLNWFSTPVGYRYTWILPPYPEDSLGYMAWAQQAAHGAWLFKIKYTALPHDAFLFHPLFLVCGWMSALFSCDLGVVFWIIKAVVIVLLFLTFYRYIDYLGVGKIASIVATILVGVSAGFGGLFAFAHVIKDAGEAPADLWMPEVTTYWAVLWNPLFPISLLVILLAIYWVDRGTREERMGPIWRSGLATGFLALIHPYSVPLLLALAAIIIVVRRSFQGIGDLCLYFGTAAPFVIYVGAVAKLHPLVAQHSALGQMKSPAVTAYLLGFGMPLLIALAGLITDWKQLWRQHWQLVLWFCLAVAFAYLPFWFQRKLVFGAHIPLCIMSGLAVDSMARKFRSHRTAQLTLLFAGIILMPLMIVTPVYLFLKERKEVTENKNGTYFISDDLLKGLKFLKEKTKPDDIVFADLATSRLIPAFAGNTVVWGHWAMSLDLKQRQAWAANVFSPQSPVGENRRAAVFWGDDIQFLFADGDLKHWLEMHPEIAGLILNDAKKVFENPAVVIYRRPVS